MHPNARRPKPSGYTLVELMVATIVLSIVMVGVVVTMQSVQTAWMLTRASVREYQTGREALLTVAEHVQRATLNPHWTPNDTLENNLDRPTGWVLDSNLHFVSGPATTLLTGLRNLAGHAIFFQGHFGFTGTPPSDDTPNATPAAYDSLPHVLNAWGYFVEFGPDQRSLPTFMTEPRQGRSAPSHRQRFRLIEFRQPAHEFSLFHRQPSQDPLTLDTLSDQSSLYSWFEEPIRTSTGSGSPRDRRTTVVAENILALFVAPYEPEWAALKNNAGPGGSAYQLAPDYLYDSRRFQWDTNSPLARATRHQLPPNLEVTLIALDEGSWDSLTEADAIQQGEALLSYMAGRFKQSSTYRSDLDDLSAELDRRRLSHKVLTRILTLGGTAGRLPSPQTQSTPTTAGP